jgi:ABC-type glycerol-3-phosphate transport system substrate-binding protein
MTRTRLAALLLPLALAGCGLLSDQTVRLLTDRPEMAAYVERYNARQSDVRVEVLYDEAPARAVLEGRAQADVVIGQWLASPAGMARFDSLADMVKPGRIDPSWFYPGLLAMGSRDNRPFLLPLSFNLPTILFLRQSVSAELPPLALPLATVRTLGGAFNATGRNGFTAVGFSPLWSGEFLDDTARLHGVRFRAARSGQPVWDADALLQAAGLLRSWVSETNGGAAADRVFAGRTLVQPAARLLSTKRILFSRVPFPEFFALPEEKRREFDFRWLSNGTVIAAQDDVLFAGILRAARDKSGARKFLSWFFSPQTQRSLLEVNQSRRIGVFCIADGLSSFRAINEKDVPQKYPLLLGRIPGESSIAFPETQPDGWLRLRDEVFRPWLSRAATGEEQEGLDKTLAEWRKAQKQ